jgi:hypothetical protein
MSPGLPAGIQTNDILILFAVQQIGATGPSATVSADWTRIYVVTSGLDGGEFQGAVKQIAWWHRYDGATSPDTTVTTYFDNAHYASRIVAIRGAPTGVVPVHTYSITWDSSAFNEDVTVTGVSPTQSDNTYHLIMYSSGGAASTPAISGESGPTFAAQFQTNFDTTTTALRLWIGEKTNNPGATGTRTITDARDLGCVGHIALGTGPYLYEYSAAGGVTFGGAVPTVGINIPSGCYYGVS